MKPEGLSPLLIIYIMKQVQEKVLQRISRNKKS
jgi:hypothetical protein